MTNKTGQRANRPLAGVTVLDFGQVYQGPYASLLMAQAGADVIKIEPPQGEPLRRRALAILRQGPRYRWRRTLLPGTPIRQIVLVHIGRRRLPYLVQAMGFVRVVAGDK